MILAILRVGIREKTNLQNPLGNIAFSQVKQERGLVYTSLLLKEHFLRAEDITKASWLSQESKMKILIREPYFEMKSFSLGYQE